MGHDMWGELNTTDENDVRKNKWRMTWLIVKCVGKSELRKEGMKRNLQVISMGPYDYAAMS